MSSKPLAPGIPGRQKVLPIRPAVPLIYEPRLRGGAGKASCKNTLISDELRKEPSTRNPKEDAVPAQSRSIVEGATDSPGRKLDDDHFPRSRDELIEKTERPPGALIQETEEVMQLSPDVSETVLGKYEKEINDVWYEKVNPSSKLSRKESFEDTKRESNSGESPRPSSLDTGSRDLVPITELGICSPSTGECQHSPIRSAFSSGEISENPQHPNEGTSSIASTVYAMESYPASYYQYPGYASTTPQKPTFPNDCAVPQYDPQAPVHFPHAWSGMNQLNGLGGQPPPTPSASVDDGNATFDSKLVEHISSSFNDKRYADIRLVVTHEKARFAEITFFLHRVLLSRSETLRGLIDEYASNYDDMNNKVVVRMRLYDRFITPAALECALRTCYGQTASTFLGSKSQVRAENHHDQSTADMIETLAFAAAGHLLKLEHVALQALEKARKIIEWDNLQYALSFGMESCVHRCESPEASLLQTFVYSTSDGELFSVDCAKFLLDLSLSFMFSSFPSDWVFDKTAKPLPIVDRLPVARNSPVSYCNKSKLASIQFGQRPPDVNPNSVDRDTLISSIVLSVPLAQLRLIAQANIPSVIGQLPQIVKERESRRLGILNSEIHWNQRRLAKETEWYAVGFQESYTQIGPDDGALGLSCVPVSTYRLSTDEEEARKRDQASQGLVQNPHRLES